MDNPSNASPRPGPGSQALRRHRESVPGSLYFVTANTRDRRTGLCDSEFWEQSFLPAVEGSPSSLLAAVLMPDHFHWIFRLAGDLASTMRSCKGPLSVPLRRRGLRWQDGYFEHRIRESEDLHRFLRYMLANPYRAGLIPLTETWPYWFCDDKETGNFTRTTQGGKPYAEWLDVELFAE